MTTKIVENIETKTQTQTLSVQEEQVVRMRHGLGAPSELELSSKAMGNEELEAKLREIEERALNAVGARSSAAKRQMVSKLRGR